LQHSTMARIRVTATQCVTVVAAATVMVLSPLRVGCSADAVDVGAGRGDAAGAGGDSGIRGEQGKARYAGISSGRAACEADGGEDCSDTAAATPSSRSGDTDGYDTMDDCWPRALEGWCGASSSEEALLMRTHCAASCSRVT
jgi:hypothetical protein